MNVKKFACLSTVPGVVLTYKGEVLPLLASTRSLGVTISAIGKDTFVELDKRVDTAIPVLARIGTLHGFPDIVEALINRMVIPAALFGSQLGDIHAAKLHKLTMAIVKATWGTKAAARARETVFHTASSRRVTHPQLEVLQLRIGWPHRYLNSTTVLGPLARANFHLIQDLLRGDSPDPSWSPTARAYRALLSVGGDVAR